MIQGCHDNGGNLKVVLALPCPKGYVPLAWNQTGQRGPKGDKGDTGPKGDPGDLALAGRSCPSGRFVTGFDSNGELVCAALADGGGGGGGGGGAPGEILVDPLRLGFPSTPVGTLSDAAFVTFTNTAPADVTVSTTLAGANATDFVLDGCRLAPAEGTCQLSVQFAPTGVGMRTATIIVQLPNGGLLAIELSGTGA